jgi:hypothetical protein
LVVAGALSIGLAIALFAAHALAPHVVTISAGVKGCVSDDRADLGRTHVSDPQYTLNPPSGGNHLPVALPAGLYEASPLPPDGEVVHAEEHGYVVIWHKTSTPAVVDALVAIGERYRRDVLVVRRPSLPVSVAATAWHHRLLCSSPDPTAIASFILQFRNQGPERPPH